MTKVKHFHLLAFKLTNR